MVCVWPDTPWIAIDKFGAPAQPAVLVGLIILFVADKVCKFDAVLPIMTPVLHI